MNWKVVIVDNLSKDNNLLKFYIRYVYDILALIKESHIVTVLDKHSCYSSLKFTVDKFDNGVVHYLDINIEESNDNTVLDKLNSFHPRLKFTIVKFNDGVVHYLDININNQTTIY